MQIVGFSWKSFEPRIVLDDGRSLRLFDSFISMELGLKRCIGYRSGSKSFPCASPVSREVRCSSCAMKDSYFMCVKCDGSSCVNPKQKSGCDSRNFFVYLTSFGEKVKIGISLEYRLFERWVEQGCRFGAKIALAKGGLEARYMENLMKSALGIADRISGEEKHSALFSDPNKEISSIFSVMSSLSALPPSVKEKLIQPEIYDMRHYYRLEYVEYPPPFVPVSDGSKVSGHVVAARGNILVIESDDGLFSVNAHDLVGRDIRLEAYRQVVQ